MEETEKKTRTPTARVGKARGGRPELLTEELQKQIIALVRMGMTPASAAMSLGVVKPTIYLWLKKGRRKMGARYVAFVNQLEQAKHMCVADLVMNVRQTAKDRNSENSKWMLERISRERWGRVAEKSETIESVAPVHHTVIFETAPLSAAHAKDLERLETECILTAPNKPGAKSN